MQSVPDVQVNEAIPVSSEIFEPRLPIFTNANPVGCLILACGNTLRSDDGVGPFLAEWAAERFRENADVRVVATQQWTPDLAERIAEADYGDPKLRASIRPRPSAAWRDGGTWHNGR